MAFDFKAATRKKVEVEKGDTYASSKITSQRGLVQYCDRCRSISEFVRFRLSGKLKYIKCTQCDKIYYL